MIGISQERHTYSADCIMVFSGSDIVACASTPAFTGSQGPRSSPYRTGEVPDEALPDPLGSSDYFFKTLFSPTFQDAISYRALYPNVSPSCGCAKCNNNSSVNWIFGVYFYLNFDFWHFYSIFQRLGLRQTTALGFSVFSCVRDPLFIKEILLGSIRSSLDFSEY